MARVPLALGASLLTAVLVRLAVSASSWASPPGDPDLYLPLARSLAEGRGLALWDGRPTAIRPPLYPLVLAPVAAVLGDRSAWGAVGVNIVLGAATVAATFVAARRWGLAPIAVNVAVAIVALDPVLVAQSRAVMTESLAALLVALTLVLVSAGGRRSAILGGAGFGLAALCRPSLLAAALLTGTAALLFGPGAARERTTRCAFLLITTAAVLAPWALRNAWALGEPVWTTTHGGYTLYLANNRFYYDEIVNRDSGAVWSGPGQRAWFEAMRTAMRGAPEPAADRHLRDAALNVIAERPRDFARASWQRLGRFWGVAPAASVYSRPLRLATAVWTVPLWGLLVLGLARGDLWRWPRVTAPAMVLALSVVHALYWTDLRMRAPLVPAIALIVANATSVRVGVAAADRSPAP